MISRSLFSGTKTLHNIVLNKRGKVDSAAYLDGEYKLIWGSAGDTDGWYCILFGKHFFLLLKANHFATSCWWLPSIVHPCSAGSTSTEQ